MSAYKLFAFKLFVKSCRIVSFLESLVFDVFFADWRIEGELDRAVLKEEPLPVDPYL
jgi:hypothetical protein